ncbi:hypothetical protein GGR77_000715 [Xanthomonas translucens]
MESVAGGQSRAGLPWVLAWVRFSLAHVRAVLALAALLSAIALPGLLRLDMQLDGHALVPPDAPVLATDTEIKQTFAQRDTVVVYLESPRPGGILDADSLRRLQALTWAILEYPELQAQDVKSLATEARDREASMDMGPYLLPLPTTRAELDALRADIEATPLVKGTLVAPDYSGASIVVQVPRGADRQAFYLKLKRTVDAVRGGDDRLHVVGAVVAESQLGNHLLGDLLRLLPLSLLLLVAALWLAFRRWWAIVIVLCQAGGCIGLTFGLMGWCGIPVYITTAVLPIMLCTMGIASEIHMLVALQRNIRLQPGIARHPLALEVMTQVHRPIVLTVLTTAIGFASFVLSDLPPVATFGIWASIGTLISLLWSLTVTPALYCAAGVQALDRRAPAPRFARTLWSLERTRGRRWLLTGALACGLLLSAGIARLQVQDGWISGFAEGSAFRASMQRVNRALLGTHLLQIQLDFRQRASGAVPPFQDPAVLAAVKRMEQQLRATPGVGGVIGPYSQLATTRFLISGRAAGSDVVDDTARGLRRLWRQLEFAQGEVRRREIVDDGMRQGLLTVYLKDANFLQTARIMADAERLSAELLVPLGGRIRYGGDVAVSQATIAANVRSQLLSLGSGVVCLFLFVFVVLRRLSSALFAVLPVTAACLAVLGCMGWLGIPLGVATSMFVAITLGIGVDFPLHLMERADHERRAGAQKPFSRARQVVGPAIIIDSLVISAGFGILALSQVPANARLGCLVALSVLTSCACTLLFVRDAEPMASVFPQRLADGAAS